MSNWPSLAHPLPSGLVEATNGTLMVVATALTLFTIGYLFNSVLNTGFRSTYESEKPAIALSFVFTGLFVRTAILLAWRHAINHQLELVAWFKIAAAPVLVLSTVVMIVGGLCWMRVMLEYRGWYWWIALAATSVTFGVYFAT